MKRVVEPELLDELSPADTDAIGSRRDLRRLNGLMQHAALLQHALASKVKTPPRRIVELGAGDGTIMLKLAEQMYRKWPEVHVTLVDRQRVVARKTLARFEEFGWTAKAVVADAFKWLPKSGEADVIMANLFLHHFPSERLVKLFKWISERTELFVATETRRDWPSLVMTRAVGLIGCNAVTRYDAVRSAQGGFARRELTALWPAEKGWKLSERRAKIFTHLFVAQRVKG